MFLEVLKVEHFIFQEYCGVCGIFLTEPSFKSMMQKKTYRKKYLSSCTSLSTHISLTYCMLSLLLGLFLHISLNGYLPNTGQDLRGRQSTIRGRHQVLEVKDAVGY